MELAVGAEIRRQKRRLERPIRTGGPAGGRTRIICCMFGADVGARSGRVKVNRNAGLLLATMNQDWKVAETFAGEAAHLVCTASPLCIVPISMFHREGDVLIL